MGMIVSGNMDKETTIKPTGEIIVIVSGQWELLKNRIIKHDSVPIT